MLKQSSYFAASGILSKAYLALVISDLKEQWKSLKTGRSNALVGIIGDSVILSLNTIEFGSALWSTFLATEASSIELGP